MGYTDRPHTGPSLQSERPPWLVFLFLAAVFFLCQHDLFCSQTATEGYVLSADEVIAEVAAGSLGHRVAFLALGIFALVSLIRHRGARLRINGWLGWIMLFFAGWAVLSLVWAEDTTQTLRRLVTFAIVCLAVVAIARRFSLREIVLWTVFTTGLYLLIGVSAEIALGTFRPFASGYRFAGTLLPNTQGINCALLLLSGVAASDAEKHRRTLFRACALLGFVFLILTASRTASAATLLALAVYWSAVCSRATKIAMAYALSIALCVLLLVLANGFLPDLKSAVLLGRDASTADSLSGRTGIWEDVGYYIHQRPILGYGYGGFWTPTHLSIISSEEKQGVPNSHSAYLDYFLTLGAVGMVAYAVLLIGGIRRAFRFHKLSQNSAFAFCGALLVFCALHGFLESAVVYPSHLMLLVVVLLTQLAFVCPPWATGMVNR